MFYAFCSGPASSSVSSKSLCKCLAAGGQKVFAKSAPISCYLSSTNGKSVALFYRPLMLFQLSPVMLSLTLLSPFLNRLQCIIRYHGWIVKQYLYRLVHLTKITFLGYVIISASSWDLKGNPNDWSFYFHKDRRLAKGQNCHSRGKVSLLLVPNSPWHTIYKHVKCDMVMSKYISIMLLDE